MKVYKEKAEQQLLTFLNDLLVKGDFTARFLLITPREDQRSFVQGPLFIQNLQECTFSDKRVCFFMSTGEVLLIADSISKDEVRMLAERLVRYMDFISIEQVMSVHDLNHEIYHLIDRYENRVKALQKMEDDALDHQKQESDRKEALLRSQILALNTDGSLLN